MKITTKGKNDRQIIIKEFIKVQRSELSLINLSDSGMILPATFDNLCKQR